VKYKLKIFDNVLKIYLEEKIVEASSSSIARKLADIHFEKYFWQHKDVTLSVSEPLDDK
tara:strand:- start:218 stop:394 length:177 start_codon:yes stop_codon:yes gene_type:complete